MKRASRSSRSRTSGSARRRATAAKTRPKGELKIDAQVWPMERDVLFRPDRLKYVRKLLKPEGCVFCAAAKGEPSPENLCVHRTKHAMVVINKFPYNSGHLLVLPRRHCGDVLHLSEDEYADVMSLLRLAMRALNGVYEPGGMNMGLNHGATAGAGIPEHLHFHLIPRWAGDLNFFPLIADTKVVIEDLSQTWSRLHAWFQEQGGA